MLRNFFFFFLKEEIKFIFEKVLLGGRVENVYFKVAIPEIFHNKVKSSKQ